MSLDTSDETTLHDLRASPPRKIPGFVLVIAFLSLVAILIVATVIEWPQYRESQRIQHGPEVLANVDREWVTTSHDRTGTWHTTHFQVTFNTIDGRPVSTTVDAGGVYRTLQTGQQLQIRYDPGDPSRAELPSKPRHTIAVIYYLLGLTLLASALAAFMAWRAKTASQDLS